MSALYLNNTGSRWIFDNIQMMVVVVDDNGKRVLRKVREWRSFGNFASCMFKYKGLIWDLLPHDTELVQNAVYGNNRSGYTVIDRCPVVYVPKT